MKFLILALFVSFLFLISKADDYYNFPDKNDAGSTFDNENKLKELLDNIAKIRREHEALINQGQNSALLDQNASPPFQDDSLCKIESQQDCEASCSKPELCRPCFKSQAEGFGVKCLITNP